MWFDGANGGDCYYGGANKIRKINTLDYYNWDETYKLIYQAAPKTWYWKLALQKPDRLGRRSGRKNKLESFTSEDELAGKLTSSVSSGTEVRLVKQASDGINYLVDFIEMEPIPAAVAQPANAVSVTSFGTVPNDANDDKQAFVSAIAVREQFKMGFI